MKSFFRNGYSQHMGFTKHRGYHNSLMKSVIYSILSQKHRVLLDDSAEERGKSRQSVVFFGYPSIDTTIECIDKSNKYPPIDSMEYLDSRFYDTYWRQYYSKPCDILIGGNWALYNKFPAIYQIVAVPVNYLFLKNTLFRWSRFSHCLINSSLLLVTKQFCMLIAILRNY